MRKDLLVACCLTLTLTGCGDGGERYKKQAESLSADVKSLQAKISAAKARITQLEQENASLKETPGVLLAQVRKAVDAQDESASKAALASLTSHFADSPEASIGSGLLQKMLKDREAKEHEYEYRSAERGSRYITANVTYSSKSKDPRLAPLIVYASNGGELKRLGVMGFEFVSWSSYATFLGNYHDNANDFAHKASIRFSMGLQVPNDSIAKPLYIVASSSGCADRHSDRFGRPPVSYATYSCDQSAPGVLRAADFKEGRFGIVKRID